MKKRILILLILSFPLMSTQSKADDWGCEVLLCLAATGGSPSECTPALNKLWKHLLKMKPFPTCQFKDASGAMSSYTDYSSQQGMSDWVEDYTYCSSPGKVLVGIGKSAYYKDVCNAYSTVPAHWDDTQDFRKACDAAHPIRGVGKSARESNKIARKDCKKPITKTYHHIRVKTVNGWGDYHRYTY